MALLKTVSIRNFRNVSSKDIVLSAAATVIAGHNMTGKTNTLNAIHWAFTGTCLDGSNDNRANFNFNDETKAMSVKLEFDSFTFERRCVLTAEGPQVSVLFNGEECKTIKTGEALLHKELGLTDIILTQPKEFNIVRFLLDPLYFDTVSPSALRKFFYQLSNTDFRSIAEQQSNAVSEMLKKRDQNDPYKLADAVSKDKKAAKKVLDGCKVAKDLFPSVTKEAEAKEKEYNKKLTLLEAEAGLVDRYALAVSKRVNKFYEKAMGIQICMLEKGVGDDVFKDVCYPILPNSKLPFSLGSQAERTFVGMKFINEVCLTWNIKPLVILLDNMESLDAETRKFVNSLGVQYIGAVVEE